MIPATDVLVRVYGRDGRPMHDKRATLSAVKRPGDRKGQYTRALARLMRAFPDAWEWEVTDASQVVARARGRQ